MIMSPHVNTRSSPRTFMLTSVITAAYRSFAVKDIHPAYRFVFTNLAEIDLGCLQILMPQDHLGHDFKGYSVTARIGGRVSSEVMGSDT